MRPLTSLATLVSFAATTVLVAASPVGAAARDADADFDSDGYSDLVVTSPNDRSADGTGRGGWHVVPGSAKGPDPARSRYFGFADEYVGARTTSGDFDGDGFDDLAVTAETGGPDDVFEFVGSVRVLFGSSAGLTTRGLQLLQPGAGPIPAGRSSFGSRLAAADFDGDGRDDLVVTAPTTPEGEGGVSDPTLWVFSGSASGLSIDDPASFAASTPALDTGDDQLGSALAAGDVDDDGFEDLAVGRSGPGYLTVLHGSASGLGTDGLQQLSVDDVDQAGAGPAPGALAIGELGRGGAHDVAVGTVTGGRVTVLYGTGDGLTVDGRQRWDAATLPAVAGVARPGGRFGTSLAVGDLGYSTYDDLAIGAFQERVGSAQQAGSVTVLVGTANGVVASHAKRWTQDTTGVSGAAERGDWFGQTMSTGRFGSSPKEGLGVSAPAEALGSISRAGGVNVLLGSGTGLTTSRNTFITQDTPGMVGVAEKDDLTGFSGIFLPEGAH